MTYLLSLGEKGIHLFSYHDGTINFGVGCFGEQAQQKLLEIAQGFKMQDVCKKYAWVDVETALFMCGCKTKVKNPNYKELEMPTDGDSQKMMEYFEWVGRGGPDQEFYEVFDPSKVKEPLEENFKGTSYYYEPEEDRVYLSEYHYKKHLNYLNSLENNNDMGGMSF